MVQYLSRRLVLTVFLILFVLLASYSQYVRPGTVVPGSTSDQIFNNADKIHREATQKPAKTNNTPGPVNNKRTNSNSGSNAGSSTINNNAASSISPEAQKAFDDAKYQYNEKIKTAMASACVCNTSPYAEVKFIYSPLVYQSKRYKLGEESQELFDNAKQLNDVKLLSGYLLNIKGEGNQVVVVESPLRNGSGKVWNPYLVQWDKDKYNKGKGWSDLFLNIDISAAGYDASLTDKMKYIEKAIVNEQEKKANELKRENEAEQAIIDTKRQADADDEWRTPKGEKINGLYNITSDGVTFAGRFLQYRLYQGLRTDKDGYKEFFSDIANNKFKSDLIKIYNNGPITIVYGPGNFNSLTSTEAYYIHVFKNGTIQQMNGIDGVGNTYFSDGSMYSGNIEGVDNPTINNFSGSGPLYRADGSYEWSYFRNGKKNSTTTFINPNGDIWKYEYKMGVKLDSKTKKIDPKEYVKTYGINYGKIPYTNGDLFTGEYYLNTQSGNREPRTGTIKFKNGDRFSGSFMEEMCKGIMKFKNGSSVYGWFKKSINNSIITINGLGKESETPSIKINTQKDIYVGFADESCEISYKGNCFYSNGDTYSGVFKKDLRIGGLLIYKNGDVYYGRFENNKPNGPGEFVNAITKEKFKGNFKEGIRDGAGILYFADGTLKEVMYKDGVLQQ